MHLTLLRSQKANAAGKTSVGGGWRKVLMELECMSIFTSMSHNRELPLPVHGTAKDRAYGSAAVGHAKVWLGCLGLTTVLETITGPSLQWYKIARNKQHQNWRSFTLHLHLNQFSESTDIKVALTWHMSSVWAAQAATQGMSWQQLLPLPSCEF